MVAASASQVAAAVLRQRMAVVQEMLPLAAQNYQQDTEHVHQLRVGCRRAGAAVTAFRPLFDHKPKSLGKWLKRIRRAAGPARDTDVLLLRMKEQDSSGSEAEYIMARLRQHRKAVQETLVKVHEQAKSGKLAKSIDRCVADFHSQHDEGGVGFAPFAKNALRSASQEVFSATGASQPSFSQLHSLRIACKRLRYSIEIFHAAFPAKLRNDIYPTIEKIQDRLGKLNDHATAQQLFQEWLRDLPVSDRAAFLARLIANEHDTAVQLRQEFLQWWKPKRIAKLESQLACFLETNC